MAEAIQRGKIKKAPAKEVVEYLIRPGIQSDLSEGEENFVGDSEIIALGGASNETKDRPLG